MFQAPPLPPKAILDSCDDPSLWQQLCTLVTGSFFLVCFLAFLLGVLFRGWGFYFFAILYIVCGQNSPPIKLLLLPQVLFRFSPSKIKPGLVVLWFGLALESTFHSIPAAVAAADPKVPDQ